MGYFGLGFIEKKVGVAIKILDGSSGPQFQVAQHFIDQSGLFNRDELESLEKYREPEVMNHNKLVTGHFRLVMNPLKANFLTQAK